MLCCCVNPPRISWLVRYQRPPLATGKADVPDEVGHVGYVEFRDPRNTFWQTLTPSFQVIQSIWSLMFNWVSLKGNLVISTGQPNTAGLAAVAAISK